MFNNVAVILLDIGKMSRSEIKEYVNDYENFEVKTLVLDGILKKRGKGKKQINIKF